jgi:FAD/FMN-containing dehydrogenase
VGELNAATLAKGLAVPSGGCPDVGIAGLTLGGGETALMSKYGTACDNVLAAEVVTADGRVLVASAEENPDLFWAIRGGSGNFGVVTSFTMRAYPMTEWLTAALSVPLSRGFDALRALRDQMQSAPDELMTSTVLSRAPSPTVSIAMVYCGDAGAGRRLIDRLRSVLRPATASVQWAPYGADFAMPPAPFGGTGCLLAGPGDDAIRAWVAIMDNAPTGGFSMANEYRGAVTRVPPDAMAFPWRQAGWSIWIGSQWSTAAERAAVLDWVQRSRESLRPFSSGVYVNVLDDEGPERVRESYGGNYPRLRTIKAKYDPTNFFRVNQNILPAT